MLLHLIMPLPRLLSLLLLPLQLIMTRLQHQILIQLILPHLLLLRHLILLPQRLI